MLGSLLGRLFSTLDGRHAPLLLLLGSILTRHVVTQGVVWRTFLPCSIIILRAGALKAVCLALYATWLLHVLGRRCRTLLYERLGLEFWCGTFLRRFLVWVYYVYLGVWLDHRTRCSLFIRGFEHHGNGLYNGQSFGVFFILG